MLLPSVFYKRIEVQVSKLVSELGITELPIPVDKIARHNGVDVIAYDLGNEVSGVLVFNGDRGTIGFNALQSKGRQRFTIAHELAHYILHGKTNKDLFVDRDFIVKFRSKKNYTTSEMKQESEANAFAAALLMPKNFILAELEKDRYHDLSENELIEELASTFEVSVMAMTYRLRDLNVFN